MPENGIFNTYLEMYPKYSLDYSFSNFKIAKEINQMYKCTSANVPLTICCIFTLQTNSHIDRCQEDSAKKRESLSDCKERFQRTYFVPSAHSYRLMYLNVHNAIGASQPFSHLMRLLKHEGIGYRMSVWSHKEWRAVLIEMTGSLGIAIFNLGRRVEESLSPLIPWQNSSEWKC